MHRVSTDTAMKECMELCWECRHECQTALYGHCLDRGGRHAAPYHVKLMQDCIDICQVAADVCERCAKSCGQMAA